MCYAFIYVQGITLIGLLAFVQLQTRVNWCCIPSVRHAGWILSSLQVKYSFQTRLLYKNFDEIFFLNNESNQSSVQLNTSFCMLNLSVLIGLHFNQAMLGISITILWADITAYCDLYTFSKDWKTKDD